MGIIARLQAGLAKRAETGRLGDWRPTGSSDPSPEACAIIDEVWRVSEETRTIRTSEIRSLKAPREYEPKSDVMRAALFRCAAVSLEHEASESEGVSYSGWAFSAVQTLSRHLGSRDNGLTQEHVHEFIELAAHPRTAILLFPVDTVLRCVGMFMRRATPDARTRDWVLSEPARLLARRWGCLRNFSALRDQARGVVLPEERDHSEPMRVDPSTPVGEIFDTIASRTNHFSVIDAVTHIPGFDQEVRSMPRERLAELVCFCIEHSVPLRKATKQAKGEVRSDHNERLCAWWATISLVCVLSKRKLPLTRDQIGVVLSAFKDDDYRSMCRYADQPLLKLLKNHADVIRADSELVEETAAIAAYWSNRGGTRGPRTANSLLSLADLPPRVELQRGEAWSNQALIDLGSLGESENIAVSRLLHHCSGTSGSRPSANWSKTGAELLEAAGRDRIRSMVLDWFALVDKPGDPAAAEHQRLLIREPHADILKGLCWIASTMPSADLARALGALAISCYRKVPGVGPRAVKIGNAAVYALGQIPGEDALGQLAMLRVKVKFGTAQKLLEKSLDAAAERAGLPRDEIEELAVPAYGLTDLGIRREELGDYVAELRLDGMAKPVIGFIKPDGKPQKSVPKAIKETHADDLKELKAAAKDIGTMLPAQRDRIDNLFLENKSWDLGTWRERYLDHPLIGVIARRLIWRFAPGADGAWDEEADSISALWIDGEGPVGLDGNPAAVDDEGMRVRLWHPIEVQQDEILAWRDFLVSREIVQPFKQAHREVYLLTDAERNTEVYSNRYAAHVLRQHQFNALCAARGWRNKLRLLVDDEFPPASRTLAAWGLRAEFWIEGAGDEYGEHTNDTGVFHHVVTDQVRFYDVQAGENHAHASGGGFAMYGEDNQANRPLPVDQVPALVFSEIMRDVDLFVGVTSVGNNPEWQDGGPTGEFREYWWGYSFGDLSTMSQTRRDLLEGLVPRLKIADRCEIEGNFLRVRGDIRTYKIHLGSGNILMEPNDQYLCIVPGAGSDPKTQRLYLPFEGDRTLSIILSKAFLLADDTQITDKSITSQIGSKR